MTLYDAGNVILWSSVLSHCWPSTEDRKMKLLLLMNVDAVQCVINAAAAGEYVANNTRLSQAAPMIEHVVIYQFDASSDLELSLAVDDRVWVSAIQSHRAASAGLVSRCRAL